MNTLHIETTGHGPDLVLVHGWGLHGGLWAPLLSAMRDRYRLHCVDLPGHGLSRAAVLPADDLESWARVLLANFPQPAVWLGWSLGGMLALTAARLAPERVTKLVLIAATPRFVSDTGWPHAVTPETVGQFAADLETDYRATLERFLSLQAGRDETGRAALRALRTHLFAHGEPDIAALRAGLRLLRDSDLRAGLGQVTTPTLVVHGGRDRLAPAGAAAYLAAHLPRAELTLLEDAGHAPMWSHSASLAERVGSFLERAAP